VPSFINLVRYPAHVDLLQGATVRTTVRTLFSDNVRTVRVRHFAVR